MTHNCGFAVLAPDGRVGVRAATADIQDLASKTLLFATAVALTPTLSRRERE